MPDLVRLRDRAAITGIGQTEFSKDSGRSELQLACEAIAAAAADAGIAVHEIDGMVRYTMDANLEVALVSALGLPNLRYFGETGYGGSAHAAVVGHAAMAIATGLASTVVCFRALNERSGRRFGVSAAGQEVAGIDQFAAPYGLLSPGQKFSLFARRHMIEFGTTSRHFGEVAVAMRRHASLNPRAMMRSPITLEDHQQSRLISDPLRLLDYCIESDGAVAVIVTSAERARNLRQRPVYVMGAAQGSGGMTDGIVYRSDLATSEATFTARDVYAMAGVGPADIDCAQFYDHFTPFVLFALEAYGFCQPGQSGPFVEGGRIQIDGDLPVNTHGGNHSEAYMHGLGHMLEGVRQLRGTSTAQVPDCDLVLVGSAVAQLSSAVILRR